MLLRPHGGRDGFAQAPHVPVLSRATPSPQNLDVGRGSRTETHVHVGTATLLRVDGERGSKRRTRSRRGRGASWGARRLLRAPGPWVPSSQLQSCLRCPPPTPLALRWLQLASVLRITAALMASVAMREPLCVSSPTREELELSQEGSQREAGDLSSSPP